MPSGVFTRRPAQFAHKCEVCGKKYKHTKRFHNHLRTGKCSRAAPLQQPQQQPEPDEFRTVLERLAILEAQNEEKDEKIRQLTADLGNLKRSLHHIRAHQQKANEEIARGQEELKKETRKLHHDKFWFNLKQKSAD